VKFRYFLKLFVDEQTARRASITPEVVRKLRNTGTRLEYSSGVILLKSKENHDIDEELVKTLLNAIGKPIEAVAEIELNGRVKEVFRGKLDPNKPLGIISDEDKKQYENGVEEDEKEETSEDEEDLFIDEDELIDEMYYDEDEDEY